MSSRIASTAASLVSAGAGKSGKPWARLTAPAATASRFISRMTDSVNRSALPLILIRGCSQVRGHLVAAVAHRLDAAVVGDVEHPLMVVDAAGRAVAPAERDRHLVATGREGPAFPPLRQAEDRKS